MATKTFKIGEYCNGGIITVETDNENAVIIQKQWDYSQGTRRSSNQKNAQELDRVTVHIHDTDAINKMEDFLHNITSSYYAEQVLDFVKSKIEFKRNWCW